MIVATVAISVSMCVLAGILSTVVVERGGGGKRQRTDVPHDTVAIPPLPPPPTYDWHFPAWFTKLHQQSVRLRQLRDDAADRAEEARINVQECEAEIANALSVEYCCDAPSPPACLTEDGLVPTNTHCENCQQGLCSNEHVVKPANVDLAAELRDELQFHRGRRQDEQIIAHEHNRKLLQLGCPHPIWVTADEQRIPPWSPLRWTGNHSETCHWCDTPRTWQDGDVQEGPRYLGSGGTWCAELAVQFWYYVHNI